MKTTSIILLFCLIAATQAQELEQTTEPHIKVQQATQYSWGLDMLRLIYLFVWVMSTSLVFFIPSVILNTQEWMRIYVYAVMYAPLVRLSGVNLN